MEKELTELFEAVKKAADAAENSPGEEDRCLDALKRLKRFPVNYQVLVSTQVGKRIRQLTKHRSDKIKALTSDVVKIWKGIIITETMKNKNGTVENDESVKAEGVHGSGIPNSVKIMTSETPSTVKKVEKVEVQTANNAAGESIHVEKKVKEEKSRNEVRKQAADPVGPPKLTSIIYCKDSLRDKIREMLAEALCKVSSEVNDDLRDEVNASDPYRVAVLVETAMFEEWGKSNGAQKFKYRSLMFNIKDQKNPDFRRKVLLGHIEPHGILKLTPEEMASDDRQMENEKIKQKKLLECEQGGPPKASTNEFTCGRCKKKECTYYQTADS
ncbi:Transcription elongation factor TFIIS [Abeliophyllum distichum]|uniref:Transcription elongation factor TFIIS n=1 Tax=Abeliophyllum distichum TaxID=126358 RepID=A0ABD1VWT1_9LAMI